MRVALVAMLAMAAVGGSLRAQARQHFTFHMYVNPLYGDDTLALAYNPHKTGSASQIRGKPLQLHPSDSAGQHKGYLQHAPYAFKTVTAALAWVDHLRDPNAPPPNNTKALPWTNPDTGMTIDYVVIHCLPGLYGPAAGPGSGPDVDAGSGLPWNGETFPLDIPQRVSIQGASVLDTIFDARHSLRSVFRIGHASPDDQHEFKFTFIDSVSIRGARGAFNKMASQGAGVLIWGEEDVDATISNCFITDNVVGVAIWADAPDYDHHTRIINNTIAWNEIGLWNGSTKAEGQSPIVCLNNIFDSSTPATGLPAGHVIGVSDFEGVAAVDFTASKAGCPDPVRDYNAYEIPSSGPVRYNLGNIPVSPWPLTWPITKTRTGQSPPSGPRVNIAPYTNPAATYGSPASGRGTLYINDVFRNDPSLPAGPVHDFRLSPMAGTSPTSPPGSFSPLVNLGIDLGPGHVGSISMGNNQVITYSPGLPPPGHALSAEDMATLNCWDWDGEGFGNKRLARRRSYPAPGCPGSADLGADELGEVIVSDFLDSTRILSRPHPSVASNTRSLPVRTSLYFFNLYHGSGNPANTYIRPQFNLALDAKRTPPVPGTRSEWFAQILSNPYDTTAPVSNYTDGQFTSTSSFRYTLVTQIGPYNNPKFMRNLVCDISAHLFHDIPPDYVNPNQWPPYWAEYPSFAVPPGDIFHTNPWYHQKEFATFARYDNAHLYYDPADSLKHLRLGIVRPPVTVTQGAMATKSYLFQNATHATGAWDFQSPPTYVYTVNAWGWAGPDVVPYVPGNDWQGLRINLELFAPGDPGWIGLGDPENNLQTFLIVQGAGSDVPPLELGAGASMASSLKLDEAGPVKAAVRRAMKTLADRRKR